MLTVLTRQASGHHFRTGFLSGRQPPELPPTAFSTASQRPSMVSLDTKRPMVASRSCSQHFHNPSSTISIAVPVERNVPSSHIDCDKNAAKSGRRFKKLPSEHACWALDFSEGASLLVIGNCKLSLLCRSLSIPRMVNEHSTATQGRSRHAPHRWQPRHRRGLSNMPAFSARRMWWQAAQTSTDGRMDHPGLGRCPSNALRVP